MSSLTERRNARARHLNHINNTRGASPMKRSTNTMVVTTSTKNVSTTSEDCNPPRSNSRIPSSSSKSVISSPDEKIDSQNVQSKSNVASKVNRLRRHRMRSRSPAVARNSNLPPNDIPNPNPSKRTLSDNNSDIKGSSVSGNSTSVNEILPTEADVTSKEQNNQVQSIPPQTSKTLKRRTADQRHRIEKLQQHRRHEAQKKNIAAQEHLDSELGKTNQEVESSLGNDGTSKAAQQLETKNESILSRRKRVQKIQAQRHKTLGLKDVTFTSDNDAHSIISISTIDTDKKLDDMFIVNNNTGQTHENDNDILAHDTETDHDYAPDPDDILPILDNDDIHNEKSPDVLQHKFKSRLQENLGFSNNTGMPQGMIPENIEGIQNSSPSADFSPSTINTNSFNHSPMSISHSNPISHPVPNNENYASPPSYQNEFPHRNQHFPSYLGNMPISPPNSKNQGQGQGQGYTHFSPTQGHPSMQSLSSSFPPISPSSPLSQVQSSFSRTPQHQIISPNNSNFDNSTMASVPASSSFVSPTQYAPSNTGSHYPESTVASEFTGAGTIGSLSAAGVPIANDMEMERRRLQSNDQEAWRLQQVELELQRRVVREAEINRIRLEEEHKRAKMKEMEQNLEITRLRMEHDKMKMEEERLAQKVQLAKLMSEQELQQRVLELKQEEIEAQAERLKEEKEALVIEAEKVRHIHEEEHQKRTQELESQKKRLIEERKQMNNKQNEQNLKEQQEQIKEQKISHDKKPDQQQEEMANDSESQDDSSQQQHSQSTTSIVLHSSRYDYGNELMKTSKSNFHKTMKSGLKDKSDRSKSSSTTMREDDDVITSLPSESPNFKLNESQDSKLTTLDYTDGDLSTEEISLGAGSQVLSDWWQRNYASSQDPEINNVIKQALSTTPKSPLDTSSQFTDDSKSTFTQSIDKTNFKHQMKIMNKASSSHADSDDEDIFSGIGDGTESESESIQYPERSKINKDSNGPKDNDKLKKPVTKTSTAFDKKSSLTSLKPKVAIGTKSFANNKSTPSPITTNYQSKNTRTSQEKRNDKNQRSNRFKNEETSTNFRKTSRKVEDNLFPAFERNAFDHEGDNMEKNVDKFTKVKKEKIQKSDLSPSDFQAMPFPKSDNDPYFQAAKSQKEKKDTGTRHDKGSLPLKHEEKNSRPLSSSFTYSDASHGSGPSFALSKAPRDTPQKHPIKEYQNSTSLMDALSPTSPTEDSAVSGYTEEFEPPALHIKNDKKHRDESPQTRANRKLNYSSMTAPDDEYEAELEKNKKNINGNLKRSGDLLNKFNNEATPNKTQNNEYDSTSNTQKYDDEEEASEENEIEKGKSEYGAEESTAEITNVLDETGSRSVDKRSKSKNISKAYQRKDLDDDDYSSEDDDSYYTEDMTDASSRDKFNQDKDERTAKSKDSSKKNEMQSFFSHYGCHMLDTLTSTICRDPNQKEKDISINDQTTDHDEDTKKGDDDNNNYSQANSESDGESSESDDSWTAGSKSKNSKHTSFGLSQQELQKWEAWDEQDGSSPIKARGRSMTDFDDTASQLSRLTELEVQQRRAQHLERRARAHEKLLLSAYSALSVPQDPNLDEKLERGSEISEFPTPSAATLPSQSFDIDGHFMDHDGNVQMRVDKNSSVFKSLKSESSEQDQKFIEIIHKFSFKLKNNGMEILKLNRDKKWQPRTLTLSKEESFLSDGVNKDMTGDRFSYPKALLWVKKFSKGSGYSVTTIDRQGKGGTLLSHLLGASKSEGAGVPALSKKLKQGKFKNSVRVIINGMEGGGGSKSVVMQCMNEKDAELLIDGVNAVVQLLHTNKSVKRN